MADAPKNKEWNQNYPSVFISEIKVTKLFLVLPLKKSRTLQQDASMQENAINSICEL